MSKEEIIINVIAPNDKEAFLAEEILELLPQYVDVELERITPLPDKKHPAFGDPTDPTTWLVTAATSIAFNMISSYIYDRLKSKRRNTEILNITIEETKEVEIADPRTGLRIFLKKVSKIEHRQ